MRLYSFRFRTKHGIFSTTGYLRESRKQVHKTGTNRGGARCYRLGAAEEGEEKEGVRGESAQAKGVDHSPVECTISYGQLWLNVETDLAM